MVGAGSIIAGAHVRNSVLSYDVIIVGDRTGAVKAFFDSRAESVLFLRPDRCIAAACIAQLAPELSARLANTLALVDGAEGGDRNAAPTRPVRHVAQPAAEPAGPVG